MTGKEKCKALKEIRKKIAESNDIEYAVTECQHKGDCKGTCPKCEAEVRYLERELDKRRRLGRAAVVAGVSTCVMTGLTACKPTEDSTLDSLGGAVAVETTASVTTTEFELEGEPEMAPTEVITEATTEDPEVYELEGDVAYIPDDGETTECEIDGESDTCDTEEE